jgi:hypothetical protein
VSKVLLVRIVICAGLLGLAACQGPPPPGALPRLVVKSTMTADNLCSQALSPAIELGRVPQGTARYRVRFQNVSVLFSAPQDYEIETSSTFLAEGAIADYRGVCPGERQRFEIRTEILALDAAGRALAYGVISHGVASTTSMLKAPKPAL